MAPTEPGTSRDYRVPHAARANVVPLDGPTEYFGSCAAGDWIGNDRRATPALAEADVADHLAEVKVYPHRPQVDCFYYYLGSCEVGDFISTHLREDWESAEGDVAAHVAEMHPGRDGL